MHAKNSSSSADLHALVNPGLVRITPGSAAARRLASAPSAATGCSTAPRARAKATLQPAPLTVVVARRTLDAMLRLKPPDRGTGPCDPGAADLPELPRRGLRPSRNAPRMQDRRACTTAAVVEAGLRSRQPEGQQRNRRPLVPRSAVGCGRTKRLRQARHGSTRTITRATSRRGGPLPYCLAHCPSRSVEHRDHLQAGAHSDRRPLVRCIPLFCGSPDRITSGVFRVCKTGKGQKQGGQEQT